MLKIYKLISLFIFVNLTLLSQISPSFDENADILFERALINYENGKFSDARSLFSKCIYDFKVHHRTTASYIMLAKTEYNLKKYKDVLRTLEEFSSYYPSSSYIKESDFIKGLANYKLGAVDTALYLLLKAYNLEGDEHSDDNIVQPVKYIFNSNQDIKLPESHLFTNEKTKKLINDLHAEKTKNYTVLGEKVKNIQNNGNSSTNDGKETPFKVTYSIAVFSIPKTQAGKKGIDDIEIDYLQALKYAVSVFNKSSDVNINLKIIPSRQDSISFANEIKVLSEDPKTLAIVGPIYSDQFRTASIISNKYKIPIISPTATGNGIASIGDYVFQANPDFFTRAKSMAIYASAKMKAKRVVLFSPNNLYGKIMTENFSREFTKRGGSVVASQLWDSDPKKIQKAMFDLVNAIYKTGGENFISFKGTEGKENIAKLKQSGLNQNLIDSLSKSYTEINIFSLFGREAKSRAEKLKLKIYPKTKYEVDQPIGSIDAIYIPINSKNDIKNISAALYTYKINARIIGTGDYNHILELEANKRNMTGLIFDSDSYFDTNNKAHLAFSKSYLEVSGRKLNQYSLFGYDALGLVLQAIKNGNTNREKLKRYISSLDYFQGVHSKISLKYNRINSYLNILEYKNKNVSRIDEINIFAE